MGKVSLNSTAFHVSQVLKSHKVKEASAESEKIDALVALAYELRFFDSKRVASLLEQIQDLIQKSPDPHEAALTKITLIRCWSLYMTDQLEEALELGHKVFALYLEKQDQVGLMHCYYLFASAHRRIGAYDQAIYAVLKMLDLAESLDNLWCRGQSYALLGNISLNMNDLSTARRYLTKSATELVKHISFH